MDNNITLTNDEIHTIRVEHSEKIKNLSFEEYKRQLDAEIAPALRGLEAVYTYIQFVNTLTENEETATHKKSASSIAGIARQYANPELIPLEKEG